MNLISDIEPDDGPDRLFYVEKVVYSKCVNASNVVRHSLNVFFSSVVQFSRYVVFSKDVSFKEHCIFNRELDPEIFFATLDVIFKIFPRPGKGGPIDIKGYYESVTPQQWTYLSLIPGFDGALVNSIVTQYIPEVDFVNLRNIRRIEDLAKEGITVEDTSDGA